jgi:hypothetical protein
MDITLQELKIMKAKQLRRLIHESIKEVLNETTYAGKGAVEKIKKDPKFNSLDSSAKTNSINDLNKGGDVELEEMARLAKGFRLADPNFDATQYANKRISGISLADVINYFRENPGAEKSDLVTQFNFARPQIANALVNGLLDAGVLVKLSASGEVEATPEPGEEGGEEAVTGPEAFLIGNSDPLAGYFDGEPNADGSEDITPEEPEIEKTSTPSASNMSDEDYEAFMKWSDLNDRLAATKSNILKVKRNKKGGEVGDIKDTSNSSELARLTDLKKSLQDRIEALIAGSDYLKKRTGREVTPPEVETPDEEESLDEGLDEYEMRKMQFYAGIIK